MKFKILILFLILTWLQLTVSAETIKLEAEVKDSCSYRKCKYVPNPINWEVVNNPAIYSWSEGPKRLKKHIKYRVPSSRRIRFTVRNIGPMKFGVRLPSWGNDTASISVNVDVVDLYSYRKNKKKLVVDIKDDLIDTEKEFLNDVVTSPQKTRDAIRKAKEYVKNNVK